MLIPTDASCTDPWVTASTLVTVTQRIKISVALCSSITGPTVGARQAAALDEALSGRLLLNVVMRHEVKWQLDHASAQKHIHPLS